MYVVEAGTVNHEKRSGVLSTLARVLSDAEARRVGTGLYDVHKLIGHSDITMTQRYAHLPNNGQKLATEGVSKYLDNVAA